MIESMGMIATKQEDADNAKQNIIRKFIHQGFPRSTIANLEKTDCSIHRTRTKPTKQRQPGVKLWLTMGFHPCWKRAAATALRKFLGKPVWSALGRELFKSDLSIRVAWKNRMPPIGQRLQNL